MSDIFKRLTRRVRSLVSRGRVNLIDDSKPVQLLQINLLAGETRDTVERLQNYGFTAHPHAGAEVLAAAVGGDRGHMVVLVVDDRRYRLAAMQPGEVALYDDQGQVIKLARDKIEIIANSLVRVTAPEAEFSGNVKIEGDLQVDGNINSSGDVVGADISLGNHTHQYTAPAHPAGPASTSPAE